MHCNVANHYTCRRLSVVITVWQRSTMPVSCGQRQPQSSDGCPLVN